MKKKSINFSWPAHLSDFSKDKENEKFSRAKLYVFYKGETEDHRYFSDSFSEKLIKSLPYTPVVSYYDEEEDDFVGHATEQQIYGIVDPKSKPWFEKDDKNVEWCVCDVVLYTERPDKVGDIAKKIVGHSQSLELDPDSVKYKINYDKKRHVKNIEFIAGTFIGVSVLGKKQKPAFTGSSFFSFNNEFAKKMEILCNYCEKNAGKNDNGGIEMNFEEFMKLSWGDISHKVDEAIRKEYSEEAYVYIVDMFDDSAIIRFYSYLDGTNKLMRVNYTYNEESNEVVLGDVKEVYIKYEDVVTQSNEDVEQNAEVTNEYVCNPDDEKDKKDCVCNPDDKKDKEDCVCNPEDKDKKDCVCDPEKDKDKKDCICDPDDPDDPDDIDDKDDDKDNIDDIDDKDDDIDEKTKCSTNTSIAENEEKVSVDSEQAEENNTSSTSFTESERAEFEALKREKKVNLLNSYKDYLTEEEYNKFTTSIDTFDVENLEVELLRKYKNYNESRNSSSRIRAFALSSNEKQYSATDRLDDFVRKNLKR